MAIRNLGGGWCRPDPDEGELAARSVPAARTLGYRGKAAPTR